RHQAHHLDPGGDHHVVGAGHDSLGREVGGLLGRAALAIDGGGGDLLGPAGGEHRVATDVERLGAGLHDAPHDDVVDQGGVQVVALRQGLEGLGGEVDRVPAGQGAVAATAGCADDVDDHCVGHGSPSGSRAVGAN